MFKIVIVICALSLNVVAQLMLKKGMTDINIISFDRMIEIIGSLYIWAGFCFYGVSFILYLYVLTKFEVSYIYPIIMSAGLILLLIFSVLFLNETFTFNKLLGILLISFGIVAIVF